MERDRVMIAAGGLLALSELAAGVAARWFEEARGGGGAGRVHLPLCRRFDGVFERRRGGIPLEYLRALATGESEMRAGAQDGHGFGLFQLGDDVLAAYDQAHGTRHERDDLLDPEVNAAVAAWQLGELAARLDRYRAESPNLAVDWDNPRFIELLTGAWAGAASSRRRGRPEAAWCAHVVELYRAERGSAAERA